MKCLFLGVYIPTEDVGEPKFLAKKYDFSTQDFFEFQGR
jgi:hypothetical protein